MKKILKKRKKIKKLSEKLVNRIFLSKVKISNIKAFRENNEINFAPMINLVFGKNSSGKSTINQSLRLFRQSFGLNKLTPFNYESPPELRGKGGLDIDVGYAGLVNNGNINKNISLGVETGIYLQKKQEISNNKKSIHYTYKFDKKFYTGKNLVAERTVLDKIYYSNSGGAVLVKLPNHVFFKDGTTLGKSLRFKERVKSGEFFLSRNNNNALNDSIYSSVYHPYYYKTKFETKNLKIKLIEEIFDDIKDTNYKIFIKFYSSFLTYLKDKQKIKDNSFEKSSSDWEKRRKELSPFRKRVYSIRAEHKHNLEKRINSFLENSKSSFIIYEDELLNFMEGSRVLKNNRDTLIKEIKRLIVFFKNKKHNKDQFLNFFKKDICLKNKDIIYFNGYFMSTKVDKERSIFRDKNHDEYLINILSWACDESLTSRTVDIFNGYAPDRFNVGTSSSSSLEDITKAMNKFVVAPGLRQIPKRYFVKGLQTDYVGPSAENLGELLANPEINKETNRWFKKLEIPYRVDIQKSGNYYEIIFSPKNSKIKISSMHVGLGYPLILPFIVQCIIARNKIILIEEPEVHLHPKIEADLADLIVESSIIRKNQFIIETHSEDFLLRILKSIRQGKLKPEDVSVNYITPNNKIGSQINKITINKFGQYTTPWKDNLFAERKREFKS